MKYFIFTLLMFSSTLHSVSAQDYRFGKVSKEELQQKQHPKDPNADAAILYREMKTSFEYTSEGGFDRVSEVFERVKIYSKEGFDWASKELAIYEGGNSEKLTELKGAVYNLENGKVVDEKLRKNGIFKNKRNEFYTDVTFTMPNLKEGTVIEYQYKIISPYIDNIDSFVFQETIPVDKVYMNFATPEYYTYKMHQKGWIPLTVSEDVKEQKIQFRENVYQGLNYGANRDQRGGFQKKTNRSKLTQSREATYEERIYEVQLTDVPALKEEAYSGDVSAFGAEMDFELSLVRYPGSAPEIYATTWEDVSKTIYKNPSFGAELSKTDYFSSDIDALISEASNDEEKIRLIFDFVKKKMNWDSFRGIRVVDGVRSAYKNNTGNVAEINLMLTAMLQYAGLNASPVLVSSKNHGIPLFPTTSGFDYVLAGVENTNKVFLMDATIKEGEINILSPKLMNWQGRILRKNRSSTWVDLFPKKPATESMLITAEISNDLNISGTAKIRYTGHYAMDKRKAFAGVSQIDTQGKLESSLGGVALSEIAFENLNVSSKPVSLEYAFEANDAAEIVGDKIYISPLLFLALKENPFLDDDRKYPVDFNYAKKDRYILNITIPEGYHVESLPESSAFAFGDNIGNFSYRANEKQNVLQLSVEFSIMEPIIPASDYANLKKFFQLLIDKENEKVVLSKA